MMFRELTLSDAQESYSILTEKLYQTNFPFFEKNAKHHYGLFEEEQLLCFGTVYQTEKDTIVTLGNFQCIENESVSKQFFENLFKNLMLNGSKEIIGPMHGTTWLPYRFSEDLRQPFFTEFIHQPYYPDYWRNAGFKMTKEYYSNLAPVHKSYKPDLISNYFEDNHLETKRISNDTSIDTIREIYDFVNKYFNRNSFFTTLPFEQFMAFGQSYIGLFQGEFSQLIFHNKELVGIFLAAEDKNNSERVIVRTIARHSNELYKQLPIEMCKRFYVHLIDGQYQSQIHAYFHEDNPSRKVSKHFGGEIYRKHSLFLYNL